ncbi:MAG: radical SAM family heme chaperone HemW [Planctomycetes bacterium]|nr:radical SAM family heme chaperone HemW [Planctomycetota bacterium]
MRTSLYVHVPFCVVKCGYCDFNSYVVEDRAVHLRFLAALDAELARARAPRQPTSVFLGGGTPTYLDPEAFAQMFAILARHVDLAACPEVTVEINPESLTPAKAAIARAAGVNRASMGVQSFAAARLRFLDRAHDAERARAAFGELRAAGFTNVSIDMIFGLPGQTLADWQADLEAALALGPDHLSCYNLTFEPGTKLHHQWQLGHVAPNDEETDRAMFLWTRERLAAAGFLAYEISNFAGRGGMCAHNDHYWLQGDYVGVGPGASSHRAGVRTTNLKPVDAWADAALAGLAPAASAETLTPWQRAGEAVWLGVRRREGVDLAEVGARLGLPVAARFAGLVQRQVACGHLRRDGTRIQLTDSGLLFADAVGAAFLSGDTGAPGRRSHAE